MGEVALAWKEDRGGNAGDGVDENDDALRREEFEERTELAPSRGRLEGGGGGGREGRIMSELVDALEFLEDVLICDCIICGLRIETSGSFKGCDSAT